MPPLLEDLARAGLLASPEDGAPLALRAGRIVTPGGRDVGPAAGPLDFLGTGAAAGVGAAPPAAIEAIRGHLQLPDVPAVREGIARAIEACGVDLGSAHLTAEARMLAERFRLDVPPLPATEPAGPPSGEERLALLSHSIGTQLTAARTVRRSVRVRNVGAVPIAAGTPVVTSWGDEAVSVATTPIPVDIAPGRDITLILDFRAPAVAAPAVVRARLGVPGPARSFLEHEVEVILPELPGFPYRFSRHLLDYALDHDVAIAELRAWLKARGKGERSTLLEIGGGVHPSGSAMVQDGHRLVSADIAHTQSILGTLYFSHALPDSAGAFGFITCDGTRLPFARAAFDGVLFFAAFHHFADPVGLLAEVRRVLKPDGFAFIACDCCAPDPTSPDYLGDLARGINEQMFSLPEYHAFFHAAGFTVAEARVDFHSLKVFIVKSQNEDSAPAAPPGAQRFVRKLYRGLLGREADDSGASHWAGELSNGTTSRAKLVESFIGSPEYQATMVPLAHLALAATGGRTPDSAKFRAWAARLRGGEPIVDIAVELTSSDVGGDREAARNAETLLAESESAAHRERHFTRVAVMLLYDGLMGRMPDDGGLVHWMGQLERGASLHELIETLLDSDEFRNS